MQNLRNSEVTLGWTPREGRRGLEAQTVKQKWRCTCDYRRRRKWFLADKADRHLLSADIRVEKKNGKERERKG